jgi:hypothetical protein
MILKLLNSNLTILLQLKRLQKQRWKENMNSMQKRIKEEVVTVDDFKLLVPHPVFSWTN